MYKQTQYVLNNEHQIVVATCYGCYNELNHPQTFHLQLIVSFFAAPYHIKIKVVEYLCISAQVKMLSTKQKQHTIAGMGEMTEKSTFLHDFI